VGRLARLLTVDVLDAGHDVHAVQRRWGIAGRGRPSDGVICASDVRSACRLARVRDPHRSQRLSVIGFSDASLHGDLSCAVDRSRCRRRGWSSRRPSRVGALKATIPGVRCRGKADCPGIDRAGAGVARFEAGRVFHVEQNASFT
jgi:hypothetical protein